MDDLVIFIIIVAIITIIALLYEIKFFGLLLFIPFMKTNSSIVGGGRKIKEAVDDFPYKFKFVDRPIITYFENIRSGKLVRIEKSDIIKTDNTYNDGDIVTDLFIEPVRMKAFIKFKLSPFEYWQKHKHEIIRQVGLDLHDQREYIYENVTEATLFSPSVSNAIYEILGGGDVFDPFGGWGDRMIGAICCPKVDSYECCDANANLRDGYQEIINTYNQLHKLDPKNFGEKTIKFNITDTLKFIQNITKKYDICFTSPPYYDYENYSDHKDQSIKGRNSYREWCNEFYIPTLTKLTELIKPSGYFAIHVGNTKAAPNFIEDTKEIISKHMKFHSTINVRKNDKRPIPILVFKKSQ
jgi:hypothetical protein